MGYLKRVVSFNPDRVGESTGFEPATHRFSVDCSSTELTFGGLMYLDQAYQTGVT